MCVIHTPELLACVESVLTFVVSWLLHHQVSSGSRSQRPCGRAPAHLQFPFLQGKRTESRSPEENLQRRPEPLTGSRHSFSCCTGSRVRHRIFMQMQQHLMVLYNRFCEYITSERRVHGEALSITLTVGRVSTSFQASHQNLSP